MSHNDARLPSAKMNHKMRSVKRHFSFSGNLSSHVGKSDHDGGKYHYSKIVCPNVGILKDNSSHHTYF